MKKGLSSLTVLANLLLITSLLNGCAPAQTPASGNNPSSSPSATASQASASSTPAAPAAQVELNGCTNYVDRTGVDAVRDITWDLTVGSKAERCMKVKVGQTVSFRGEFASHPLKDKGGNSPNLFSKAAELISNAGAPGQEYTPFEFKTAGTFGYVCGFHPSMTGAILVVP